MTKPKRKTPEADLQIAIVEWFEWAYPDYAEDLHHSPNGGERPAKEYTNKRGVKKRYSPEGAKLKAMGTKDGWPDLQLPVPAAHYHGFFLEVKAPKTKPHRKKDAKQMERLIRFSDYYGYYARWTNSFEGAIRMFNYYMGLRNIKPRVKV